MAEIALKGNPVHTTGDLPAAGAPLPAFTLTRDDLSDVTLADFSGKRLILNIFPSIDTPTCATSVRKFNEQAAGKPNTQVLCISADLPFAQKRFCGAEGIDKVVNLSTFRHTGFGHSYGTEIVDGAMAGLQARAVVVADEHGHVLHTELVEEIAQEPDYEAALAVL